jgi:hypothetical protein
MEQLGYFCSAFALTPQLSHLAGSGQHSKTLFPTRFIFDTAGQGTTKTGREKLTASILPVDIIGQRFQLWGGLSSGHCPFIIVHLF